MAGLGSFCLSYVKHFLRKYSLSLVSNIPKHVQKDTKIIVGFLSTAHASICNHVCQLSCEAPPSNQHSKLRACAHIPYTHSSQMCWS